MSRCVRPWIKLTPEYPFNCLTNTFLLVAFVRIAAKHIPKVPKQNVKIRKDNKSYTYTVEYIHMSQCEAHTQMNWARGPHGFRDPIIFQIWQRGERSTGQWTRCDTVPGPPKRRSASKGQRSSLYRGDLNPKCGYSMWHNPITLRKVLFTHSVKCLQNVQAEKNRTKHFKKIQINK